MLKEIVFKFYYLKKCNKLKRLNTNKIISNKILNYIEHENCKN